MRRVNDAHPQNCIASTSKNFTLGWTASASTSIHNADEVTEIDAELYEGLRSEGDQTDVENDFDDISLLDIETDVACPTVEALQAKKTQNVSTEFYTKKIFILHFGFWSI